MSTLIHTPERRHNCGISPHGVWPEHLHDPAGTVRRCGCGRTWIAIQPPATSGWAIRLWRRESWLEPRRRERKARP